MAALILSFSRREKRNAQTAGPPWVFDCPKVHGLRSSLWGKQVGGLAAKISPHSIFLPTVTPAFPEMRVCAAKKSRGRKKTETKRPDGFFTARKSEHRNFFLPSLDPKQKPPPIRKRFLLGCASRVFVSIQATYKIVFFGLTFKMNILPSDTSFFQSFSSNHGCSPL